MMKSKKYQQDKVMIILQNDDYTTGYSLDYAYFKESYRLIVIDASKESFRC